MIEAGPFRCFPPKDGEGEDVSTLEACAPNIEGEATWAELDDIGTLERVLLPKAKAFPALYWLSENSRSIVSS